MKKIIGLTGPTGAGKGTVASLLKTFGAHTIDGDIVARRIVTPQRPALAEIVDAFGDAVLKDGVLDRKTLANIVFQSPDKLHKLNQITHKYITEEILKEIENSSAPMVIIDAAALIESGIHEMCDFVICVTAEKSLRLDRIMARDGLTKQQALARINAQKEDGFYISNSDFHIENNGDEETLFAQVQKIMKDVQSDEA